VAALSAIKCDQVIAYTMRGCNFDVFTLWYTWEIKKDTLVLDMRLIAYMCCFGAK